MKTTRPDGHSMSFLDVYHEKKMSDKQIIGKCFKILPDFGDSQHYLQSNSSSKNHLLKKECLDMDKSRPEEVK